MYGLDVDHPCKVSVSALFGYTYVHAHKMLAMLLCNLGAVCSGAHYHGNKVDSERNAVSTHSFQLVCSKRSSIQYISLCMSVPRHLLFGAGHSEAFGVVSSPLCVCT